MITTERLQGISEEYFEWGDTDLVGTTLTEPIGVQEMPKEWKKKLGIEFKSPRPKAYIINDVHLAGGILVGIKNNDVILDTSYYGRMDVYLRNKGHFSDAVEALNDPAEELDFAVSFMGSWSGYYFHWVIDHLPKLEAVLIATKLVGKKPVVLINKKPQPFVIESLQKWDPVFDYKKATKTHYHVDNLLVIETPRQNGYLPGWIPGYLRDVYRMHNILDNPQYYVTRRFANSRRVVNEDEITNYLLDEGFSIGAPEKSSFQAQVDRFANVNFIIGPHGGGLANMVWGHAPAVLEIVTPEYTNPCYWMIASGLGWPYGFVIGQESGTPEDMYVDPSKLKETVEEMNKQWVLA